MASISILVVGTGTQVHRTLVEAGVDDATSASAAAMLQSMAAAMMGFMLSETLHMAKYQTTLARIAQRHFCSARGTRFRGASARRARVAWW